jgi:hypothetical protein
MKNAVIILGRLTATITINKQQFPEPKVRALDLHKRKNAFGKILTNWLNLYIIRLINQLILLQVKRFARKHSREPSLLAGARLEASDTIN